MYIKKILFGAILLVLLLQTTNVMAASEDPLLFMGGQKANPEIRVIRQDGTQFINLPILNRIFNMTIAWNMEKSDLFLQFGKMSIKLYAGNPVYYINGVSQTLTAAPVQADNQFWLPLEFLLRLGLSVQNSNESELRLDWSQNYLFAAESTTYQNRPALLLIGARDLPINDSQPEPDRIVLELPGVSVHDAFNELIGVNPFVKQLSIDQTNPDTPRLVVTLNKPAGYRLVHDPDHPNRVFIVFNYSVDTVRLSGLDTERKIEVETSLPADYKVIPDPGTGSGQLAVDLSGAALGNCPPLLSGDGRWVDYVQMAQRDPQTVRMTVHFIQPSPPCFVVRSRDNPNVIAVKTVQSMRRVDWQKGRAAETLSFTADGELFDVIKKNKNNTHIQVTFNYLQLSSAFALPVIHSNYIKNFTVIPLNPTQIKAEFDLKGFADYRTELSADRRTLEFHFKPSPLVGKTIVLDPGHGGEDNGACGRQGTREKDNNLEIAMHLKDFLEARGASVYLTRTDDYFVGLYERSFMANFLGADLFISVHTNNHPNLAVRGIEVWHFQNHQTSAQLAKDVLDEMVRETGFRSLGVKTESFVVVREAQMPGILVEVGFLSNFDEETVIRTPEFRENVALGIYEGIADYLER